MKFEIKQPTLADYQEKILSCSKRFTVTEASTKSGKTFCHLWWLFKEAHDLDYPEGSNFWWVAPIFDQSEIAFKRLVIKVQKNPFYKINYSKLIITTPRNTVIRFKSADKPDSLFGEDVYAAVFDEFTRAKYDAWIALRTTLTYTRGKCKLIGNFTGLTNWGHLLGEKAKEKNSEYEYFKITAYDAVKAKILSLEEIEQARKDLNPVEFKALYLAEGTLDKTQLIKHESILAIFTNTHIRRGSNIYSISDIARYGSNRAILTVWAGWVLIDFVIFDISSTVKQQIAIENFRQKYGIPLFNIKVDEDGIGGGVKDNLRCQGFVANHVPTNRNYNHFKDECGYKLSEIANRNEIYIECEMPEKERLMIIEELEQLKTYDSEKDNKLRILPKEKIKENIGRSPDWLDVFIMRASYNVRKPTLLMSGK